MCPNGHSADSAELDKTSSCMIRPFNDPRTPLDRQAVRSCYVVAAVAALSCLAACGSKEPAVCAKLPGTAEQLAGTPRRDADLELLAISLSEGITADDHIYKRLVRDVAAIRPADPRMLAIQYAAPDTGDLLVAPKVSNKTLVRLGLYRECEGRTCRGHARD